MKKILILFAFLAASSALRAQTKDTSNADTLRNVLLKQVTVTNSSPQITIKPDKVVLNVESMANAAGLNVLELLRQSPGVTVDGQDNVKMSGKTGIQVLLDGRLQTLSSQQLVSLLKGTNAANIKTIEIIANPSAKYDAAGNAGIINLVFKKSEKRGASGSLTAGYQQMQNYRQNSAFNFNLKAGKLSWYTNANFDNSLQHTKVQNLRVLEFKTLVQAGLEKQGYSNPGVRTGIDYSINDRHKLGAIYSYQRIWDDFPSAATTIVNDPAAPDVLLTTTDANLTEHKASYNINYQYTSKNKTTISFEADHFRYQSSLNNQALNFFNNSTIRTDFLNSTGTKIALGSLQADLAVSLNKTNLETGFKFTSSETDNILNAAQSGNDGKAILQYNNFHYKEKNYASYTSINRSFKKWSLQFGLRAEYTVMQRKSVNEANDQLNLPDTTYFNIFPTVFISYAFSEEQSLGFSYNRRINRPSFQDQNPYRYRTDFFYANQGNPLLLPQFTQTLEMSYTFKKQTQLKVNFNQTKDLIEIISTQTGDQTLTLPVNAGERSFLNISISSPAQLTKYWSIYYTAEPYYQFYKADLSRFQGLTSISNGGFGFNSYLSNTFTLSNTVKATLSSWFNYASRSSIYSTKPIYSIDAAIKKQLLTNKLNMTLAYRDLFDTQRWQQKMVLGNVNQTSIRKWESSGAYLALSYNFGNGKIKGKNEKEKSAEQQRIKQRN